jgi:two-component system chemotaxis response regulator CheB
MTTSPHPEPALHGLKPISKPRGWPMSSPTSPTTHRPGKLIAVIVSGYDGDGAAALSGIKEVGAVTRSTRY